MSIFQNRSLFGHRSGRLLATLFLALISGLVASQPASASTTSSDLSTSSGWAWSHDSGTPGSSWGSSKWTVTPSGSWSRQMYMTYSYYGGERWHLSWGNDGYAHSFIFDTYVYMTNPSQVANVELDMNQVTSSGETMLYGTQCSSYSKTWEYSYTYNGGPHWKNSNVYCNPKTWSANAWHHVQIAYHRDDYGNITHDWVALDGYKSYFSNTKSPGGLWLGWAKGSLVVNYQIDGGYSGSGSVNSFVNRMYITRW